MDRRLLAQVTTRGLVVLVIGFLAGTLLMAVRDTADLEVQGACMALSPQAEGRAAPGFELPDLTGRKVDLSSLRGKVVLLNFWATWCPPCVEELPSLARLARAMAGEPVELVTVSVDEKRDDVTALLDKGGALLRGLSVLLDPDRKTAAAYGTVKFPETYLIDRNGRIRYKFINKRQWDAGAALACVRSWL